MKIFSHKQMNRIITLTVWSGLINVALSQDPIRITDDFPGGNIKVDKLSRDTVWVRPDQRDTDTSRGKWFYWYYGVEHAGGKRLTFTFTQDDVFADFNPAMSLDRGITWEWLELVDQDDHQFTLTIPENQEEVRFSMAMPYTEQNFYRFVEPYQDHSRYRRDTLCMTHGGRDAEVLFLNNWDSQADYLAVITVRHHACEMMASYVLEGMIRHVLEGYSASDWLTRNVDFVMIPFVDKDGVEAGDQGKLRKPHDHNRDYYGESLYPTVAAIREKLPGWSKNKQLVAFDLHCPYIGYEGNEAIFLIGHPRPRIGEEQMVFMDLLDKHQKGTLTFNPEHYVPFGQGWNNFSIEDGKEYGVLAFSKWVVRLEGVLLSTAIEIPYSNNQGQKITPGKARLFGKDLVIALQHYLRE